MVDPQPRLFEQLLAAMTDLETVKKLNCPEQELLAHVFQESWLSLPYIYNAHKTWRWEGVHSAIWRDENVKNIHFILKQKPWQETPEDRCAPDRDPLHERWWAMNTMREEAEAC